MKFISFLTAFWICTVSVGAAAQETLVYSSLHRGQMLKRARLNKLKQLCLDFQNEKHLMSPS